MSDVSIFILTLNEEINIEACMRTVDWADDIVVLDSFSTDRTVEIAEACGARVVQRKFDNWSSHQNWAMRNIKFKHRWVFYLDADERMTEALRAEVEQAASDPESCYMGYYCQRTNFFMGKPITRVYPPVDILRFFRPEKIRFERLVNPIAIVDGPTGRMRNRFLHYNFSKGIAEWVDKHNKYSTAEALEADKILKSTSDADVSVFSGDRAVRRMAIKNITVRLPGRPFLKVFYLYFVRMGFLDGIPGLTYCVLIFLYEILIAIKLKELHLAEKGVKV